MLNQNIKQSHETETLPGTYGPARGAIPIPDDHAATPGAPPGPAQFCVSAFSIPPTGSCCPRGRGVRLCWRILYKIPR